MDKQDLFTYVGGVLQGLRTLLAVNNVIAPELSLEQIVSLNSNRPEFVDTYQELDAFDDTSPTSFNMIPPPSSEVPPWEDLPEGNEGVQFDYDVGVPLTDDQINAFLKFVVWWRDKRTKSAFALRGAAGTGKTTLLRLIQKNSRLIGIPDITFTAPANKAAQVIADTLGVSTSTIYSILGLRMTFEEDEMVLTESGAAPRIDSGDLLVIDEAGTAAAILIPYIENVCQSYGIRVMIVGDPYQWTPIGEKRSKSWNLCTEPEAYKAVLKQVVRFDNAILNLSVEIRKIITDKRFNKLRTLPQSAADGKDVIRIPHKTLVSTLVSLLKEPADVLKTRALAWRNDACDDINAKVREHFSFTERWHVGEICCVASPIMQDGNVKHYIDEEGKVLSVTPGTTDLPNNMPVDILTVEVQFRNARARLTVIANEGSDDELASALSRLAARAKATRDKSARRDAWKRFWELREKFHELRYPYAMTSHRMQGSTYENIIVDTQDIFSIPEPIDKARAFYVGCTRPSTTLYLA